MKVLRFKWRNKNIKLLLYTLARKLFATIERKGKTNNNGKNLQAYLYPYVYSLIEKSVRRLPKSRTTFRIAF